MFINYISAGVEYILRKSVDYTKVGGTVDSREGCSSIKINAGYRSCESIMPDINTDQEMSS